MSRGGRTLRREEVDAVLRRLMPQKRTWPADKVERRDPETYQRRGEVMIRICTNPFCRHWTPTRFTHCQICHTPRVPSH